MLGIRALCVYGVRLGYTFALFCFSLAYSYSEVAPPRYSRSDLSK